MGEHHHLLEYIPGYHGFSGWLGHALEGLHTSMGFAPIGSAHIGVWHVSMALFILLLCIGVAVRVGWTRMGVEDRMVPDGKLSVRSFFELIIEGTYTLMRDIIGEKQAPVFLPLIGGLAVFIFLSNLMGLVPGMQPPTGALNTTVACAIPVFVATHYYGVKEHGIAYFKHFLGPIIAWYALPLMLVMLVIETISHLARPMSLSLRLFGNITGDHMVLGMFLALASVPLIFPVPVFILGILVAVVQTLVFCLLSMVYVGLAVAHEDH